LRPDLLALPLDPQTKDLKKRLALVQQEASVLQMLILQWKVKYPPLVQNASSMLLQVPFSIHLQHDRQTLELLQ
jgi:hypothetical protein